MMFAEQASGAQSYKSNTKTNKHKIQLNGTQIFHGSQFP